MPLTAYSISRRKELDVQQLLNALASRDKTSIPTKKSENVPENWKHEVRVDLECPSCFIRGAEIVREAISTGSGKAVRQACFRFVSPGHHQHCDFALSESANTIPENLVAFNSAQSFLTKAVRDLVCAGIQGNVFDQKSIRDMREWFFRSKHDSRFIVTLDPKLPAWIEQLRRSCAYEFGTLPESVQLSSKIVSIPGFNWTAEARRILRMRYQKEHDTIYSERLFLHTLKDRVELLARRYHQQSVFDPTVLEHKYRQTQELAGFITHNYKPIERASPNRPGNFAVSVLALAALLLFVSGWDSSSAFEKFAVIAKSVGQASGELGNVMGLNPFHDFEAWDYLKKLQYSGIRLPENEPKVELTLIEENIRSQFEIL